MRSKETKLCALFLTVWLCAAAAFACGGWFPNDLLSYGGGELLAAPEASFRNEIQAMRLVTTSRKAIQSTNGHPQEAAAADLAELRIALTPGGRAAEDAEAIIQRHATQRDILSDFSRAFSAWQANQRSWLPTTNPAPTLASEAVTVTPGLPGEFADYFRGAAAWHYGQTNEACAAWLAVLQRPAEERHFRSTWAAFMLGKAKWETDPAQAVKHFRETRTLAAQGFADSIGLAVSSLGWEARVAMRHDDFIRAIDLYLEQAAAGDESAYNSLKFAASEALTRGRRSLPSLATHPRAQAVITAYVITGGWAGPYVDMDGVIYEPIARLLDKQARIPAPNSGWHKMESPVRLWLDAVEKAGVREVASAERLALAAYQAGEMSIAKRWIKRAPDSSTAQWLEAKLLLREGKVDQAAAKLARLSQEFPYTGDSDTGTTLQTNLLQRLSTVGRHPVRQAPEQIQGELGALKLARREYTEALDALLRSAYWDDAAYVADRVLTLKELTTYVDRNWPASGPSDDADAEARSNIRTVLALRLIRTGQFNEARAYLATAGQALLDEYLAATTLGRDPARTANQRAADLWRGAQLVFQNNWLFTAPVGTDWDLSSGLFSFRPTPPARLVTSRETPNYLPASVEERQRVAETGVYPERDWYYRFIAAGLGWEAAQLMPDNTDETAHVLWQAGTWIKYADPKAADVFYKALVNRCRKTALGDAADRRRWFPLLGEQGNILPFKSRAPEPVQATATNMTPSEVGE